MDTFFLGLKVPEEALKELESYLKEHKIPKSIFLQNVLCNDLDRAVLSKDAEGILNLGAIVNYLHLNSPKTSWGSEENYRKWIRKEKVKL